MPLLEFCSIPFLEITVWFSNSKVITDIIDISLPSPLTITRN